jgi:hypothetical protein
MVRMLQHPTSAGTSVYGQCAYDACARAPTTGKAKTRLRTLEAWPVCRHEAFPAYIAWEQGVAHQALLRTHWSRAASRGAPRKGAALLQGMVFCGRCGRKMGLQHSATREKRAPASPGSQAYPNEGGTACQCMSATGVDAAVTALLRRAVTPAKVDLAVRALHAWQRDRAAARAQWALQLHQADDDVQ